MLTEITLTKSLCIKDANSFLTVFFLNTLTMSSQSLPELKVGESASDLSVKLNITVL